MVFMFLMLFVMLVNQVIGLVQVLSVVLEPLDVSWTLLCWSHLIVPGSILFAQEFGLGIRFWGLFLD